MELLEGETLAERLARGPLPLAQVLRFGSADRRRARRGAPARDRAPRPEARQRHAHEGGREAARLRPREAAGEAPVAVSGVSTLAPTREQPLTEEGTILGTFQYMAPEQLEGDEADARTDIFALGARALRDGDGPAGVRGQEPAPPDRARSCRRSRRRSRASSRWPRRRSTASSEVPREGSRGPLAERARRDGRAAVDRRGRIARRRAATVGDAPARPRERRLGGRCARAAVVAGRRFCGRLGRGARPRRCPSSASRSAPRTVSIDVGPPPSHRTVARSPSTPPTAPASGRFWLRPLDALEARRCCRAPRRLRPILVAGQPLRRVRGRRQAAQGSDRRRAAADDLRRAARLGRHLESERRDPVRRPGRRSDLEGVTRRAASRKSRSASTRREVRPSVALAGVPARRPALSCTT